MKSTLKNNKEKSLLTETQTKVLEFISSSPLSKTFYFTGGTALAEIYLQHRYSEDLDFFAFDEFDETVFFPLEAYFKKKKLRVSREIRGNRHIFIIYKKDKIELKIELVYFPFEQIEKGPKWKGLRVESLKDIAVNKIHALVARFEPKDYVDLYCILKTNPQLRVDHLRKLVTQKFGVFIEPLSLAEKLNRVSEIKLLPRMIWEFNIDKLKKFINKIALQLM